MDFKADQGFKSYTVEAVIIRADGTVEDKGVVDYWHRNPIIRLLNNFKRKVRKSWL